MGCLNSKPAICTAPGPSTPSCHSDKPSRASPTGSSGCSSLMIKARVLLQELMTLQGPDAASHAAEIILKHMGCGSVSIIASTSKPNLFIRLSGRGMFPARTYHRSQILLSADSCAAGLFRPAAGDGETPIVLYRSVNTADEAASMLPQDWEQEYRHSSMRTFLAVPVAASSSEPMLGVLTLASCQSGAFWESWWEPLLGIIASGLVPLLQDRLTSGLVELAMHVLSTVSVCDFVTAVLQHTNLLLESIYNKSLSVRLGLLSPDHQSLLLVLPTQLGSKASSKDASGMTISCGSLAEDLRLLQLPASQTMMLEALTVNQPRVVRNTSKLLEDSKEPCNDVFVDADDVVSSIIAAPLLSTCRSHCKGCSCCISHGRGIADVGYSPDQGSSTRSNSPSTCHSRSSSLQRRSGRGSQHQQRHQQQQRQQQPQSQAKGEGALLSSAKESLWYGCLYVANQSPYDFDVELPAITALSKMLTVLMLQCMPASMAWQELCDLRLTKQSARHSHSSSNSSNSTILTILTSSSSRVNSQCGSPSQPDSDNATAGLARGQYVHIRRTHSLDASQHSPLPTPASPLSEAAAAAATTDRPMATSSIVETLRRQVQLSRNKRITKPDESYVQELQLTRLIGKGGFGTVYAGTWQGSPVAFKVMYVTQHERHLLKSAVEMAVLTCIQHPNIVRVYACLTDLVEEAGPMNSKGCDPLLNVRYRPAPANDKASGLPRTLCNIVVMEYLDKGNLLQAMRRGLLHKRLPNKGLVVDMRLLNTVLLQVAHSLQHLHEHDVIHSDVKCENVLLASSCSSPIGFVCKLGDFGLARLLMGNIYIRNRSGSGTVAYQAPEVFVEGSKLTPAVDVYSFGIMMYELYSCRRPYPGLGKDTIANRVYRQHQRPQFPSGTWPKYQHLAERCWSPHPEDRPHIGQIIHTLQQLLDTAGGPFTCASPFAQDIEGPGDSSSACC